MLFCATWGSQSHCTDQDNSEDAGEDDLDWEGIESQSHRTDQGSSEGAALLAVPFAAYASQSYPTDQGIPRATRRHAEVAEDPQSQSHRTTISAGTSLPPATPPPQSHRTDQANSKRKASR
jgi:hypothetical protein